MQSTERFEKVNIDRLVPYARNARTHSKEQILQLRASLREFGFVNPVIVDKELNIIATMCDERTRLFRDVTALLEDFCEDKIKIFSTRIPSTVKVGEANYMSRSIMDVDPKSKAADAYTEFAKEVINHADSAKTEATA